MAHADMHESLRIWTFHFEMSVGNASILALLTHSYQYIGELQGDGADLSFM